MTRTDPIADFATGLRNAQSAGRLTFTWEHSKMIEVIAKLLEREGFIEKVEILSIPTRKRDQFRKLIKLHLRYLDEHRRQGLVTSIRRLSKPGRRVYMGYQELKPVRGGTGITIVSTSRGVMTDIEARRQKVGGEVLLEVY